WAEASGFAHPPEPVRARGSDAATGFDVAVELARDAKTASASGVLELVVCDALRHRVCVPVRRTVRAPFARADRAPSPPPRAGHADGGRRAADSRPVTRKGRRDDRRERAKREGRYPRNSQREPVLWSDDPCANKRRSTGGFALSRHDELWIHTTSTCTISPR